MPKIWFCFLLFIPTDPPSLSGIVQDNILSSFLIYLPASYTAYARQNRPKSPGFADVNTATSATFPLYDEAICLAFPFLRDNGVQLIFDAAYLLTLPSTQCQQAVIER